MRPGSATIASPPRTSVAAIAFATSARVAVLVQHVGREHDVEPAEVARQVAPSSTMRVAIVPARRFGDVERARTRSASS